MNSEREEQVEEGFIPYQFQITLEKRISHNKQQVRPFDYEPRVLVNSPIIKKFPKQFYKQIPSNIDVQDTHLLSSDYTSFRLDEQKIKNVSTYECYLLSKNNFKLIYTKNSPLNLQNTKENIAYRKIELNHLIKYNEKDYRVLKQVPLLDLLPTKGQTQLQFDSKFQCGNLHSVFKSNQQSNCFHCFVQNDTNTNGYNQWFYFSIRGPLKNTPYRFIFPNLRKKFSFFKQRMRPVLFSVKKHIKTGSGWYRSGYNIKYQKSHIYQKVKQQTVQLYSLSFEIVFNQQDDYVTISSGFPYSYSRLIYHLKQCNYIANQNNIFSKIKTVTHTLCNNQIPQLIITSQLSKQEQLSKSNKGIKLSINHQYSNKKIIIILARQHSGQTNSSFLLEQIMYSLTAKINHKIRWLLQTFQLRIFPIINVDGVIYGNTRCDVAGFDLNRNWKYPLSQLHPQIYSIKKQIKILHKTNKIAFFLDLHSHSRKYNMFNFVFKFDQITEKVFSMMLSKNTKVFNFPSCQFGMKEKYNSTARAVIAQITNDVNATTLESSYYGIKNNNEIMPFNTKHFKEMALSILCVLKSYLKNDKNKKQTIKYLQESKETLILNKEIEQNNNSGSDSDPQKDIIPFSKKMRSLIIPGSFLQRIQQKYLNMLEQQQSNKINQQYTTNINTKTNVIKTVNKTSQIKDKTKHNKHKQRDSLKKINFQDHSEQKKQLRKSEISKYNIVPNDNELPQIKNWKNSWTKGNPKRIRRDNNKSDIMLINSDELLEKQRDSSLSPDIFDDKEFKREMKFLYKELRDGLRSEYLKQERNKINYKLNQQKSHSKNFASLNNIVKIQKITKSRNQRCLIGSLGPPAFKTEEEDSPILRIKSEHYDKEIFDTDEINSFRFNINHSENVNKKIQPYAGPKCTSKGIKSFLLNKISKFKNRSSFRD